MELGVLSYKEALEYAPKKNSYGIRIFSSIPSRMFVKDLEESENWVGVKRYCFDDRWPRGWREYDWGNINDSADALRRLHFRRKFDEARKGWPLMTWRSFSGGLEAEGYPWGRSYWFNDVAARQILDDFEEVRGEVENVVVHCEEGIYRGPAVGIALNDIFGWGIRGLKEKHFRYRRLVYSEMIKAGRDRFK
ncbi:hypothetical protein HNV12_03285 [Methanococcoides sp. SA1]|nr:hypothetical protein [Methanococcoides sp. SA1]